MALCQQVTWRYASRALYLVNFVPKNIPPMKLVNIAHFGSVAYTCLATAPAHTCATQTLGDHAHEQLQLHAAATA
jgi:hypothetical protein